MGKDEKNKMELETGGKKRGREEEEDMDIDEKKNDHHMSIENHHILKRPSHQESNIKKNKSKQSLHVLVQGASCLCNPSHPDDELAVYVVLRLNCGKGSAANTAALDKGHQGEWNEEFKLSAEKDLNFCKLLLALVEYHRITKDKVIAELEYDLSLLEKDTPTPVSFDIPHGGALNIVLTAKGFGLDELERERRARMQQEALLLENSKIKKLEAKSKKKLAENDMKKAKLELKNIEMEIKRAKKELELHQAAIQNPVGGQAPTSNSINDLDKSSDKRSIVDDDDDVSSGAVPTSAGDAHQLRKEEITKRIHQLEEEKRRLRLIQDGAKDVAKSHKKDAKKEKHFAKEVKKVLKKESK